MPNLHEILANAQQGDVMTELGNEFGLTPEQTRAAVAALLPAISVGIKRATETPEGLGNLLALMGAQPDLQAMYDDPQSAFADQGPDRGQPGLIGYVRFARCESSDHRSGATTVRGDVIHSEEAVTDPRRRYHLRINAQRAECGEAFSNTSPGGSGRRPRRHTATNIQARRNGSDQASHSSAFRAVASSFSRWGQNA
jgi:hypothetical protein